MSSIIFDLGSGNTLKDEMTAIKLIDAVKKADTGKHTVTLKAQLFESAPPNIPLDHHIFLVARAYAWTMGYNLTSSVFDRNSLSFLLSCDTEKNPLPFVKVACRPDLYWLIGEVPRRIRVYFSFQSDKGIYPDDELWGCNVVSMCCVPEYPADIDDYPYNTNGCEYSDHTVGLGLWHELKPKVWEKHLCLERDPNNPDSGPFALTPDQLSEVL